MSPMIEGRTFIVELHDLCAAVARLRRAKRRSVHGCGHFRELESLRGGVGAILCRSWSWSRVCCSGLETVESGPSGSKSRRSHMWRTCHPALGRVFKGCAIINRYRLGVPNSELIPVSCAAGAAVLFNQTTALVSMSCRLRSDVDDRVGRQMKRAKAFNYMLKRLHGARVCRARRWSRIFCNINMPLVERLRSPRISQRHCSLRL
jgi:hypothetical protein